MQKKTLIITLEFPPTIGGIATYVHDLANALDPNQTIVLAPVDERASEWDQKQGYTIIRKRLLSRVVWPRWIRLFFLVRKMVKEQQIELIMVHHILPVGYVAAMCQKLCSVPFLVFSHGTDFVTGTATPWKQKMFRWVATRTEGIVFNSQSLKSRFLEKMPAFEQQSLVVYPCPEVAFGTAPDAAHLEMLRNQYALDGKKVILSIGRLVDGKGFPHLVRALPEVLKIHPNLVWFIIGTGEKQDDILAEIQKYRLQNIVRFVGAVPHEELRDYYHLADLFVLLTHPDQGREEGLGLVFLEAAAAGLPIVAGKSGGVEEAVIDGQTGIVVDVHQGVRVASDVIITLLGDENRCKTLGNAGKQRIQSTFSWAQQLEKLDEWIKKI